MKRLIYVKVVRLNQLHDEIVAALPALKPAMIVEETPDGVALTVPDDTDAAAIGALVEAHTPKVRIPPPVPTAGQVTALRQLAQSAGDLTPAQLSAAARALLAVLRHRTGDV